MLGSAVGDWPFKGRSLLEWRPDLFEVCAMWHGGDLGCRMQIPPSCPPTRARNLGDLGDTESLRWFFGASDRHVEAS